MSYNSENGIISAPVSIDDVKQALGESSNDLATLCKSVNLNPYSKYKPVNLYNKPFVTDTLNSDKQSWSSSSRGWWLGNNSLSDQVYTINTVSSFEELSIKGAWNYNMPFGTSQSPYRLSDFIGYNTEDYSYQDPIRFSTGIRDTIYLDQTYYLRFYFGYEPINSKNTISFEDILALLSAFNKEWYPAVCIYNKTKKRMKYLSGTVPINNASVSYNDEIPDSEFIVNFKNQSINSNNGSNSLGFKSEVNDEIYIAGLLCPVGGVDDNYFYTSVTPCPINNDVTGQTIDISGYLFNKVTISTKGKPTYYTTVEVKVTNFTVNTYYGGHYYIDGNNGYIVSADKYIEFSFTLDFGATSLVNLRANISSFGQTELDNLSIPVATDINVYAPKRYLKVSTENVILTAYATKEDAENEYGGFTTTQIPIVNKIEDYPQYKINNWNIALTLDSDRRDHDTYYEAFNFKFVGEVSGMHTLPIYKS